MEKSLHIACGQLVFRPGNIVHQLAQIESLSAEAARLGARLILFGEAALNGYVHTPEVLATAVASDGLEAGRLRGISRVHDIVIAVGVFECNGDQRHVSHFVVFPDGRLLVQRKNRLTPKELEAKFTPGPEERQVFEVDGVRCAVSICADSGIPDLHNKLAASGCQVSLHPCAGGGGRAAMCHVQDLADPERRKRYLADMEKVCFVGGSFFPAADHRMAMVATNLAGDDGVSNYHPGHSCIIDSRGCLVALQPGEYVVEYLRPLMIHGEAIVQEPRVCAPADDGCPTSGAACECGEAAR